MKRRNFDKFLNARSATWMNVKDVVAVIAFANSGRCADKACKITEQTLRVLMCPQAQIGIGLEGDAELGMSIWDRNASIERVKKAVQAHRVNAVSLQIATFAKVVPQTGVTDYATLARSKEEGLRGALAVEKVHERGELGEGEVKEIRVFPKHAGAIMKTAQGREAKKGQDDIERKWLTDITVEEVHQGVTIMSAAQELPVWNDGLEDDLAPLK